MKRIKVWAVLGATEGLGPATIDYLLLRDQAVIALTHADPIVLNDSLKAFTGCHGLIEILIDNLAYGLIDGFEKAAVARLEAQIEKSLHETLDIVKLILPYMVSCPPRQIISMPPKPFMLMDSGEPVYDERADAVKQYCSRLEKELLILDDKITYLAPKGTRSLWRE